MRSRYLALALPTAATLAAMAFPTAARAAIKDTFGGASAADPKAPGPKDGNDGSWGVAEQTGAATYTMPIVMPPGRGGTAPSLALRYSSSAPMRGGVANGWTMGVSSIEVERSSLLGGTPRYDISLGGASGRLIPISDVPVSPHGATTYRVDFDGSFTRVERVDTSASGCEFSGCRGGWLAVTPDGTRHYFDDIAAASDAGHRWMITQEIDASGNSISYVWSSVTIAGKYGGRQLTAIEYGANAGAGLGSFARVELTYAPLETCTGSQAPIGSSIEYEVSPFTWRWYRSPERLLAITTKVRDAAGSAWRQVRRYDLGYDSNALRCDQMGAPYRMLTSITQTGWNAAGVATTAPAATFEYDRPFRTFGEYAYTGYTSGWAQTGARFGATSTLMDLDGDGLADQVMAGVGSDHRCTLTWHRGVYGGGFEPATQTTPLPTARWSNGTAPVGGERCDLAGQLTYSDTQTPTNCPSFGSEIAYRFEDIDHDGRVDLLASVWGGGNFRPKEDAGLNGIGLLVNNNHEPPTCEPDDTRDPESFNVTGGGGYLVRVYHNNGGAFALIPQDHRLNFPLAPASGSEDQIDSVWLGAIAVPSLADLNGDGWIDQIGTGNLQLGFGDDWGVWPGGPSGPVYADNSTTWSVPNMSVVGSGGGSVIDESNGSVHPRNVTTAMLRDVSGDGLPDLIIQSAARTYYYNGQGKAIAANTIVAFFNTGTGFSDEPMPLAATGSLDLLQTDIGNVVYTPEPYAYNATRSSRRRLIDVDGDGYLDQVLIGGSPTNTTNITSIQVAFGHGDGFLPPRTLDAAKFAPLARALTAVDGVWHLESDFADASGDGLPDLVTYYAEGLRGWTGDALPVRTLSRIKNGHGGTTQFLYANTTDPSTVTQSSSFSLPGPRWVVHQVSFDPGDGQPQSTTSYHYENPTLTRRAGRADEVPSFAGFRRVVVDKDLGARLVHDYSYALPAAYTTLVDGSGQLVNDETWQDGALVSVTTKEYQAESLLFGAIAFTHPTLTLTRTCADGQSADACRTDDSRVHRVEEVWEPKSCMVSSCQILNAVRLYLHTQTIDGAGSSMSFSDRRTTTGFQVRYGQTPYAAGDYRVLATTSKTDARHAGTAWVTLAKSETVYDDTTGWPIESRAWSDASTVAVTSRTYDAAGNVLTIKKPEQQGTSKVQTFVYDTNGRFALDVINELDHAVHQTWDAGTGQRLSTLGPAYKMFTCPNGSGSCARYEGETLVTDGLGRTTSRSVALGNDFVKTPVETIAYDDVSIPNRVTHTRLVDAGGVSSTITTELDGSGRAVVETIANPDGAPAITRRTYDAGGQLSTLDEPDPTDDSGATVRSAYGHDGLGRLRWFRRPGSPATGIDLSYDGLRTTIREVTGDASGGTKVKVADVFGRLVELHEQERDGSFDAVTHYAYDGANRLVGVTDADGHPTTFSSDWLGRRTMILRDERVWAYRYDRDGNQVAEISPYPDGATEDDYTTTMTFDALDRPRTKVTAPRSRSNAQRDAVGDGRIVWTYDSGVAERGRLTRAEVQRWDGALDAVDTVYAHDAMGHVSDERRTVRTPAPVAIATTLEVVRTYNPRGDLLQSTWSDGQAWRLLYDGRGLVSGVDRLNGATWVSLARYTRSIGGKVRTRSGLQQGRALGYDAQGRIVSDLIQRVQKGGPPVQRALIAETYWGNGSLATISGQAGGVLQTASYSYDALNRVLYASGPDDALEAFSYTSAGNVATATVSGAGPVREVDYHYGARDAQAVDSLTSTATGLPYAAYSYDLAGNVTQRNVNGQSWTLTWDGEDQLRQADGPTGREIYLYDGNGARAAAITSGEVRVWLGEAEWHYDAAGNLTKRYLHPTGDDETVARIEDASTVELQYGDVRHDLVLSLRSDGGVAAAFRYGAFGEVMTQVGGDDHTRRFNGKEHDPRTGLRYYGARYYDPIALRWTGGDPLFRFAPDVDLAEPQRQNVYTFTRNNPVRFWDPDGRKEGVAEGATRINYNLFQNDVGGGVAAEINDKGDATLAATLSSSTQGDKDLSVTVTAFSVGASAGPSGLSAGITLGNVEGHFGPFILGVNAGASVSAGSTLKASALLTFGIDLTWFVEEDKPKAAGPPAPRYYTKGPGSHPHAASKPAAPMPPTDTEVSAAVAQSNGDFAAMMELAPVVTAEKDQKRTIVSPTSSQKKGCAGGGLGCSNIGGAYPSDTDTGGLQPGSDLK